MKYSLWLGETTEGFEWCEENEAEKGEKIKSEVKKRGILTAMAVILAVTYVSGGIVSADNVSEPPRNMTYADGAAVQAGAYGGAVNELDYVASTSENEREARINELASAYIEEHTHRLGEGER